MEITESLFKNKNMRNNYYLSNEECKMSIVNIMKEWSDYAKKFELENKELLRKYKTYLEEYLTKNLNFIKLQNEDKYKYCDLNGDEYILQLYNKNKISDSFQMSLEINCRTNKKVFCRYYNHDTDDITESTRIYGMNDCSSVHSVDENYSWEEETEEWDNKEWNRMVGSLKDVYNEVIQARIDEGIIIYVEYIEIGNTKYKCDKIYKNLVEVFKNCVLDNYEDNEV